MDAASFKKMFLPYHRKLYGVAFRLLGNEDDACDVLQDAYLKLWDKRKMLIRSLRIEYLYLKMKVNLMKR